MQMCCQGSFLPWIDGWVCIELDQHSQSWWIAGMMGQCLLSCFLWVVAACWNMFMMAVWMFLVVSFFFLLRSICLLISLWQRLFDSITSLFWIEITLICWLITDALLIIAVPAVMPVAVILFAVIHWRCLSVVSNFDRMDWCLICCESKARWSETSWFHFCLTPQF